jgi:hypothetical protein
LIDRSWCFDTFAERLAGLPPITSAADILRSELLLAEDGPFSVRYCPFDYVNPQAKVVIVGITPGLHQMFLSCQEAQRTLADGPEGDDVLRRACDVGSFAGSMRTNLVTMLDGLALPEILGIASVAQLFGQRSDLLHSTSALIYPVFISGKNYSGSPDPLAFPLLRAFVDQVLATELAMVPDAVIIPLGRTVATLLRAEVDRGAVVAERCLFDFPHPSGANGHRAAQYKARREAMTAQVAEWSAQPSGGDRSARAAAGRPGASDAPLGVGSSAADGSPQLVPRQATFARNEIAWSASLSLWRLRQAM